MSITSLKEFSKGDIDRIVTLEVPEGRHWEYKEALFGDKDDDKKEFLADVTSFANAGGGTILYGIREKRDKEGKATGIPEVALGLTNVNFNSLKLRIENILATSIEPKISGIRLQEVAGFSHGPLFIISIPQSWSGPHMVTYKSRALFYARTSAGKYPLDVYEIGAAFRASEGVPERIRLFRDERLKRISQKDTPVLLHQSKWLSLHILPVANMEMRTSIDLENVYSKSSEFCPIGVSSHNLRYNMDGVCIYTTRNGAAEEFGYTQVFRSGAIEMLYLRPLAQGSSGGTWVQTMPIEDGLIKCVSRYLAALKQLEVESPLVLMVSLVGFKGASLDVLGVESQHSCLDLSGYRIDRELINLPDIWIEDIEADMSLALRPVFDAMWQASGLPRSRNYEDDGTRKTPGRA